MKHVVFVVALLLALWPFASHAAEYAALEGRDFYAGGVVLVFFGENPAGDSARESFIGPSAGGLTDGLAWQAFMGFSWDDGATMFGGSVDAILADNFAECGAPCQGEAPAMWWAGAGGTLIAYQDLFETASGSSVSGEELGINVGAGYFWEDFIANIYVHFFPDSSSTLISASVMKAF
ncbi:hypothetical protein JW859_06305 [bacterium]|nr:hypothetical protein [bacterium]